MTNAKRESALVIVANHEAYGCFDVVSSRCAINVLEGNSIRRIETLRRTAAIFLAIIMLMLAPFANAAIWYVDASRPDDSGDGTSWATAEKTIQAAIDDAGASDEIWVAAGTYTSTSDPVVTMAAEIHLYGGFDKAESVRADRDWVANVTVIDGEDTRRCVHGALPPLDGITITRTTLDGFTITRGTSGGHGGGIYHASGLSVLDLSNCTISYCHTSGNSGGGLFCNGTIDISDCVFSDNYAGSSGGGVYSAGGLTSTIRRTTFIDNVAGEKGGGIEARGTVTIENCIIAGNSGGGIDCYGEANVLVMNSTIYNNSGGSQMTGYGVNVQSGAAATITNSIVYANSSLEIAVSGGGSSVAVDYSLVSGGYAGNGNISIDPMFVNTTTNDYHLSTDSPAIDAGTSTGAPSEDFDGNFRPLVAGIDMGAYEMPQVVYVDIDTPVSNPSEDGLTWATAYDTIQEGIDAAFALGEPAEVWVAEGTYTDTSDPVVTMAEGVHLLGGFSATETARIQRDWVGNLTTIDGEDARRGVHGANNATLDGFTVTRAYTSGHGGGMYNLSVSPTVSNCTFSNSSSGDSNESGGGMYNSGGSPIITNCSFIGNSAGKGGGMANVSSSPRLTNCYFSQNFTSSRGAGMYNSSSSSPDLINCTFEANTTGFTNSGCIGAGMYNGSSSPTLTNCKFLNNVSYYGGGGMFNDLSSPVIVNTTFIENTTRRGGGGLYNRNNSSPSLTNCIFLDNWTTQLPGGAVFNDSSSPIFMNCTIANNSAAGGDGGGFNNEDGSSPVLTNCILWGNTPLSFYDSFSVPVVTYSLVEGGYTGTGNIDADPLFADSSNGDLRLHFVSVAVDTGTSSGAPSTDIEGNPRPANAGFDMGAHEFQGANQDLDSDGLPDVYEVGQGLDPGTVDAKLIATIDYPSDGASFRVPTTSITLSGRISSPYVDAIVVSTDGGTIFDKVATISGLTWSYVWTPTDTNSSTPYEVVVKAANVFGGFTTTGPIDVYFYQQPPVGILTYPRAGDHVRGLVTVTGTANVGQLGLTSYQLSYVAGSNPDAGSGWVYLPIVNATVVDDDVLDTWDVTGLAEGPYVLRLEVVDILGTTTTHSLVEVDHDYLPPVSAGALTITGQMDPLWVTGDLLADVTGLAEPGSSVERAEIVDGATLSLIGGGDVTNDITIHLNGVIRGTIQMPSDLSSANQVALRLSLRDASGNISTESVSNFLLIDNTGPLANITFPPDNALIGSGSVSVIGTTNDGSGSGIALVEFRANGGNWAAATGSTNWSYVWVDPPDDTYSIDVRATDNVGNQTTVTNTGISVDATRPSAVISAPIQDQVINAGAVIDVVGTAKGGGFALYIMRYEPYTAAGTGWIVIPQGGISNTVERDNETLVQWDTTGLSSQRYTLQVIVVGDSVVNFDMQVVVVADLSLVGIPDISTTEDTVALDLLHIPDFASALAGDVETMSYRVVNATDSDVINAGVVLDENNNIDLLPGQDWSGTVSVTVEIDSGSDTTTDTFDVTVYPVNDPPAAPEISISHPTPLTTDDLTVSVDFQAPDVEGTTITHSYRWLSSSDGIFYTAAGNSFPTLLNSATVEGDYWKCEVTPNDGSANGPKAAVVVRIVQDGGISLDVTPLEVTLGNVVDLSGGISPDISDARGQGVNFSGTIKPSGGSTVPSATTDGSSEYVVNDFLPNRGGTWQFEASWAGNGSLGAGTSTKIPVTVSPVTPTLDVALDTQTAGVGFTDQTVTVTVSAGLPVALNDVLDGLSIKLNIREHDGTSRGPLFASTDSSGIAVFEPLDFEDAGIVFGKKANESPAPGKWEFLVEFFGDDNLTPNSSPNFGQIDTPFMTLKDGAGYAIIVVGKLDAGGEGLPEHSKTADNVYRAMLDQGLSHDDIYYMREQDGSSYQAYVDDTSPNQTDFLNAISLASGPGSFLVPKLDASAAPVWIVLVDHGGGAARGNVFYLFDGTPGNAGELTPAELNTALDTIDPMMNGNDLVLVNGSCYSGVFIPTLSKAGRTIVTSAAADQVSHRGLIDPIDGIRDGEVFVTELFRGLGSGLGLYDAFQRASTLTADYTSDSTNTDEGSTKQTPLIDANGDASGTTSEDLTTFADTDGALIFDVTLGISTNAAGDGVGWSNAASTIPASVATVDIDLFANATDTLASHVAWIEVKTPGYSGGSIPTGGASDLQQEVSLLAFNADTPYPTDGAFTFNGNLGTTFDTPGTYKVYYFIKDGTTDIISSYVLTTVYRSAPANNAPDEVPALITPADGAETPKKVHFVWSPATDPDGDALTYTIQLATDSGFGNIVVEHEGIANNFVTLDEADGVVDLETYYWRVIPVDEFGSAATGPHLVRSFTVDQTNPPTDVFITGFVFTGTNTSANYVTTGRIRLRNSTTSILSFDNLVQNTTEIAGQFGLSLASTQHTTPPNYTIEVVNTGGVVVHTKVVVIDPDSDIYPLNIDISGSTTTENAEDARFNFDEYDTNNNGTLSSSEWAAAGLDASHFTTIKGGDSQVTMEELLDNSGLSSNSLSPVYVNFDETEAGDGSSGNPLRTLGEALGMVVLNGSGEIRIKPGDSDETFRGGAVINPGAKVKLVWLSDGTSDRVRVGAATQAPLVMSRSENATGRSTMISNVYEKSSAQMQTMDEDESDSSRDAFNSAIFETIIPLTTDADGDRIARADGTLALRLRDYTGLQLETLWAELHPEHSPDEVVFEWLPVSGDHDDATVHDIWILFAPQDTWYLEDLLTIAAGGTSAEGAEVLSDIQSIQVESAEDMEIRAATTEEGNTTPQPRSDETDQGIGHNATLTIITDLPGLNDTFETITGHRINPDEVFRTPQRVWLPIPANTDPADLGLMYYKGREPNQGWHKAENVEGFLTDDESIIWDGFYGVVVNHAGTVALEVRR